MRLAFQTLAILLVLTTSSLHAEPKSTTCNGAQQGCGDRGCDISTPTPTPELATTPLAAKANPAAQKSARLVVFTAEWCGFCQAMKPAITKLQAAGHDIALVDSDQRKDLVAKYNVRTLPTTFVILETGTRGPVVGQLSSADMLALLGGQRVSSFQLASDEKLVSCRGLLMRRRARGSGCGIPENNQQDPIVTPVPELASKEQPLEIEKERLAVANAFMDEATLRTVQRGTVRILNYLPGPEGSPAMTGQVVAAHKGSDGYTRAYILTCWHGFMQPGRITVTFPDGYYRRGKILATDVLHDMALVMCYAKDDVAVVPVADTYVSVSPTSHPQLINVGYGATGALFVGKGPALGYLATSHNADVVKHVPARPDIDKYVTSKNQLTMKGEARSGDSGGGIYSEDGKLQGVIWGTQSDPHVYGTYAGTIHTFLKSVSQVQWQRAAKRQKFCPEDQPNDPMAPITGMPPGGDDPMAHIDPMDPPGTGYEPPGTGYEPPVVADDHDAILQALQSLLTAVNGLDNDNTAIQTIAGKLDNLITLVQTPGTDNAALIKQLEDLNAAIAKLPTQDQLTQLLAGQNAIAQTQEGIAGTLGVIAEATDKAREAADGAKTAAAGAQISAEQAAQNLAGVKTSADAALAKLAAIQEKLNSGTDLTLTVDTPPNLSPSYVDVSAYWAVQRSTGISHIVLMINSQDPDWNGRLKAEYEAAAAKFPMIRLVDVQSTTLRISPVPQMVVYYHTAQGNTPQPPAFYKGDRQVSEALQLIVRQS